MVVPFHTAFVETLGSFQGDLGQLSGRKEAAA